MSEKTFSVSGDLGSFRREMTRYSYTVSANGSDLSANFTPSLYEAYLQIYKTPREAIKNYSRYTELSRKKEKSGKLGSALRPLIRKVISKLFVSS